MREIRKSGSEGGARQTNVSFLPLSLFREAARSFALEGHPPACPISLARRGSLSVTSHASSLHGPDDQSPRVALSPNDEFFWKMVAGQ